MSDGPEKRNIGRHACEACRKAKIRCLIDTLEEHGRCRKCYTSGIECEWKAISKTRNRKRTDVRVSELERQVSSLTAALQNSTTATTPDRTPLRETGYEVDTENLGATIMTNPQQTLSGTEVSHASLEEDFDVSNSYAPASGLPAMNIQQGELSESAKKQLLEAFETQLLPQCPVVTILSNLPLSQLEESRPYLTRAVLAAGSSVARPGFFQELHHRNITLLSQAVLIEGQKSLDLVQALLITSIWSYPPESLAKLSIYQWAHMACTMALELGLGGRSSLHAHQQDIGAFLQNASEPMMERYRTMFGVYIMCSRSVESCFCVRTVFTNPV